MKRAHYPLPVIDDILSDLPKARALSIVDAQNGFSLIKLDQSSSELTTVATPFGRYCWKRLPFGISPAPMLFQQKLEDKLTSLKGVSAIADDILIYGEGDTDEEAEEKHDQ